MAEKYQKIREELRTRPRKWLVTGVAGFIGSHLLEELLSLGQEVVGVDNFATGHQHNLDDVKLTVGDEAYSRLQFVEADVSRAEEWLEDVAQGVDVVLHQAALGSVPRSIVDPISANEANVTGFVKMAFLTQKCGVKRFVYASSSSVYGTDDSPAKLEDQTGSLLSPYAVTKKVNELYAHVFCRAYGTQFFGLRYFNVFGPRQDPNGAYAAVIPRWIAALLQGEHCTIFGDGGTSRDFCYIRNVVQANILAGAGEFSILDEETKAQPSLVANVACGDSTSLLALYDLIRSHVARHCPAAQDLSPVMAPFRQGDILHSRANVDKAAELLGYAHEFTLQDGIGATVDWYAKKILKDR